MEARETCTTRAGIEGLKHRRRLQTGRTPVRLRRAV